MTYNDEDARWLMWKANQGFPVVVQSSDPPSADIGFPSIFAQWHGDLIRETSIDHEGKYVLKGER